MSITLLVRELLSSVEDPRQIEVHWGPPNAGGFREAWFVAQSKTADDSKS